MELFSGGRASFSRSALSFEVDVVRVSDFSSIT